MKNILLIVVLLTTMQLAAQPTGYYNGTEGKTGTELKDALNDIISGHMEWAYFYASDIFLQSDADPETPGNVITVYKGSSVDGTNYGTGGDYLNREHVWAKSHGQFDTELPTGGDAHNLKPSDGSVNVARSNKDFDNCQATGTQHDEATGCYYTSTAWEPRDEVKGDIARIIFYMATRYEGENGEVDLEVNDQVENSPQPLHGRLSALLQWNEQDPPDAFERNRNNAIFGYQQNRNPFIDNPEWVNMIWDGAAANSISIANVSQSQNLVFTGDAVDIAATITGTGTISATLYWGTDIESMTNTVSMNASGDEFTAQIPAQASETDIYYTIEATDDNGSYQSVPYTYHIEAVFSGTIQTIAEVQGEQAATPFEGQEVTITGVVTANFGEGFFIQDGTGPWSGIYVYDVLNPQIGDSVILTGTVTEYYDLTEVSDVTDYYLISRENELPAPETIQISDLGEAYESVVIKIAGAECTNTDLGYGMWEINDGTGSMAVHNTQIHEIEPSLGTIYDISGPLKWDFGEWKIELRGAFDTQSGDHTSPTVNEVTVNSATSLKVVFSEIPEESSALDLANYSVNNGISVTDAAIGYPLTNVMLTIDELTEGDYEITISDVEDGSGNVMESQTIAFSFSTGLEGFENQNFRIYPNPTVNGKVTLDGIKNVTQIQITDAAGRVVKTKTNTKGNNSIIINQLNGGIYFVTLTTDTHKQFVSKLIVR